MWELQVAKSLVQLPDAEVSWLKEGPDLKVEIADNHLFVECTTYQKSFAVELYISEILQLIDIHLRVQHIPFTVFSLPKDDKVDAFLDELLCPFLDDSYIRKVSDMAVERSPVRLEVPQNVDNLFLIYESEEPIEINSDQPWSTTGDPMLFLRDAWDKALKNKKYSNKLSNHHPNLLAINFLLGVDYQLARMLRDSPPALDLYGVFDGVLLAACGIDKLPSFRNAFLRSEIDFPLVFDFG